MLHKTAQVLTCLGLLCCWLVSAGFQPKHSPAHTRLKPGFEETRWVNIETLGLEGIGWQQRQHTFDRLPAKARDKVSSAVWSLSQQSAGIHVRFLSNARSIKVRWHLRFNKDLNHMAATGVKGLDLYVKDAGRWRWAAVGRPGKVSNEATLLSQLPGTEKEYLLYLPLYDGVDAVSIGLEAGENLRPAPVRQSKPLFFYGTSIVQGACASRPGMAYPAIIGRSLDRETVNLGFSGNGKLDVAVAQLLAETDAGMYVLDCLPNLKPEEVLERTRNFVQALRKVKPLTPILLVENIRYADEWIRPELAAAIAAKNKYYRQAYQELKKEGIKQLYYLDNKSLTPADAEGAVDGVHLTDYGFKQLAASIEKQIKKIKPR